MRTCDMSESRGDELALAEHNYETNGRQAATTKYVSRDLSRPGGAPSRRREEAREQQLRTLKYSVRTSL